MPRGSVFVAPLKSDPYPSDCAMRGLDPAIHGTCGILGLDPGMDAGQSPRMTPFLF